MLLQLISEADCVLRTNELFTRTISHGTPTFPLIFVGGWRVLSLASVCNKIGRCGWRKTIKCNCSPRQPVKNKKVPMHRVSWCTCTFVVSGRPPRLTPRTVLSAADRGNPFRCRRNFAATLRDRRAGHDSFFGDAGVRQISSSDGHESSANECHAPWVTHQREAPPC